MKVTNSNEGWIPLSAAVAQFRNAGHAQPEKAVLKLLRFERLQSRGRFQNEPGRYKARQPTPSAFWTSPDFHEIDALINNVTAGKAERGSMEYFAEAFDFEVLASDVNAHLDMGYARRSEEKAHVSKKKPLPEPEFRRWVSGGKHPFERMSQVAIRLACNADYPSNNITHQRIRAAFPKRKRGPKTKSVEK